MASVRLKKAVTFIAEISSCTSAIDPKQTIKLDRPRVRNDIL